MLSRFSILASLALVTFGALYFMRSGERDSLRADPGTPLCEQIGCQVIDPFNPPAACPQISISGNIEAGEPNPPTDGECLCIGIPDETCEKKQGKDCSDQRNITLSVPQATHVLCDGNDLKTWTVTLPVHVNGCGDKDKIELDVRTIGAGGCTGQLVCSIKYELICTSCAEYNDTCN